MSQLAEKSPNTYADAASVRRALLDLDIENFFSGLSGPVPMARICVDKATGLPTHLSPARGHDQIYPNDSEYSVLMSHAPHSGEFGGVSSEGEQEVVPEEILESFREAATILNQKSQAAA